MTGAAPWFPASHGQRRANPEESPTATQAWVICSANLTYEIPRYRLHEPHSWRLQFKRDRWFRSQKGVIVKSSLIRGILLCASWAVVGCADTGDAPAGPPDPDRLVAVAAPLAAPASIGPGGYALPLVTGWATGNVAHSFDANNNALAIAGGATGSNPTAGYWTIPVSIEVGQSLSAVAMTVRDTAGAPVLASIVAQDVTTRATTTWCSGASAGTGLVNTVTWACSGTTMPAGSQMVVLLTPQGQTATIYGMWMQPRGVVTVPIAINGPRTGASPGFQGDALFMTGPLQTAVFQVAGIPSGSVLTGARVRVRDNATGPTRLNVVLYPSTDGVQGSPIATSADSSGSGLPQTLTLSGFSASVSPLRTYSLYVNTTTGSAQVSVLAIDVDYQASP